MFGAFDDHGIRFEYPSDWELELTADYQRTTISLQAPDGVAFAMVTLDEERPAPSEMADEALSAMKDEYPNLDASPAIETIDGHKAVGHDIEFFSLDLIGGCLIRCFRTARRTVMIFGQWSEAEDCDPEDAIRAIRMSIAETDA